VTGGCGSGRGLNRNDLRPEPAAHDEDAAARRAGVRLADGTADTKNAAGAERHAATVDGVTGQVVGAARLRAHACAERQRGRQHHEYEPARSKHAPARLPSGVPIHACPLICSLDAVLFRLSTSSFVLFRSCATVSFPQNVAPRTRRCRSIHRGPTAMKWMPRFARDSSSGLRT
jgi:hypothetical protein